MSDFYQDEIKESEEEGRKDAEKGIVRYPYDTDYDDPYAGDMNLAYKDGFMKRRKELGDKFKWA